MNKTMRGCWAAALAAIMLAGCGGGGDGPWVPAIGPAGGTVTGANGATIVVPPGALAQEVDLRITEIDPASANLPVGVERVSAVYALTPHGTAFSMPVTVAIPFDPAKVPMGRSVKVLKTTDAALVVWADVAGASAGSNSISVGVTGFSHMFVSAQAGPPTIDVQPANVSAEVGQSATFTVSAGGSTPLAYQWQRAADARQPFADIAGENAPSLTLNNLQLTDDGARLRVRVSNALGSVLSDAAALSVSASCTRAMARRVAMGLNFAAAVGSDGSVWTWGRNDDRQLGPGSTHGQDRLQPAPVPGIGNAVAVFPLFDGFAVLRSDGRVLGWGNVFLRTGFDEPVTDGVALLDLTQVVQVAGGASHTLALRADGTVWAWGSDLSGQLGNGTDGNTGEVVQVNGLSGVTAIAAPENASLAVRSDGSLWAWGQQDADMCLGPGGAAFDAPQRVTTGGTVAAIAKGNHTLLWNPVGPLQACGRGAVGNVFAGADTATAVNVPPVAVAVSGRFYDSAAAGVTPFILTVDAAGVLNGYSAPAAAASGVNGTTGVCEVSAQLGSAVFVRSDGSVWTWGDNDYGQLGDGTRTQRVVPVRVPGLNLN
jgi:hypothetical protein